MSQSMRWSKIEKPDSNEEVKIFKHRNKPSNQDYVQIREQMVLKKFLSIFSFVRGMHLSIYCGEPIIYIACS